MKRQNIDKAAEILCDNRLSGRRTGALPADLRPTNMADAYAIQTCLRTMLQKRGWGAPAGYKIGCTTRVMQTYLGIDQPCAGTMFTPRVASRMMQFDLAAHARLGVECELAVRLGKDLAAAQAPHNNAAVSKAVCAWMPSLEIVEDRYDDYENLGAPTLIADDFFHAACVLGPPSRPHAVPDIAGMIGRLTIDGAEVGQGRGSDILGDPLNALVWLANHLGARGETLARNTVVTLGSVIKTVWIDRPCRVEADFPKMGRATAVFV